MTTEEFGEKPQLLLAALCERAIRDSENMLTLVRLIDVINIGSNTTPETMSAALAQQGAPVQAQLVLVFKGGPLDATHDVVVLAHSPKDEVHEFPLDRTVFGSTVPGAVPGANYIVNIQMSVKSEGTYWFEVKLDGEAVRSVPLQIVFLLEPSKC